MLERTIELSEMFVTQLRMLCLLCQTLPLPEMKLSSL